jgi:hypothetical protein
MNNSKLDELFRNWLALVEAMQSKDDDEVDRLTDEMIVVEHAILAGTAETDDDRRAQVAMLVHYAVNQPPYANYEVLEQWYRRLVIERLARCFAPHPGRNRAANRWIGRGAPFRGRGMTADFIKEAFEVVTSMEDGLEEARISADGISILATDALHDDEQLGAVFIQLARLIAGHCKALEERRGELFRLLHPNRDHFEKEGWPA